MTSSVIGLTSGYEATRWPFRAELSLIGCSFNEERTNVVDGS